MIGLILEPAGPGRYRPLLDGAAITKPTRQPLLDAARVLLAPGYPADTPITARHVGSDVIAMRSTVGEAARWTIEEPDRGGLRKRPWMPRSSWGGSAGTAAEAEADYPASGAPSALEAA
jgi:hypothetical protein